MPLTFRNAWPMARFTWGNFGTTSTSRSYSRMSKPFVVIEVTGEGRTDIGDVKSGDKPKLPTAGVVPVLLHNLCEQPGEMRVICRPFAFLPGHTLESKVHFAKQRAKSNGHSGA